MANEESVSRADLLRDMKRTKGVRFNAAKRLEKNEKRATRNIAYASALVVVITLLPAFFPMPRVFESFIDLSTVGLSIFILASSLLHSSNSGLVKAEQFQRCALEVNSLRRELSSDVDADLDLLGYSKRYDEILSRYNVNHDAVDYDQYRLEHPDEFPSLKQEEVQSARKNVLSTRRSERAFQTVIYTFGTAFVVFYLFYVVSVLSKSGVLRALMDTILGNGT